MAVATVAFLVVDFLRLHLNPFKDIFVILFGSLLRRREFSSLTGGSYLMLASLVCMLVFGSGSLGTSQAQGKAVFIAAVSFLVVGDTLAAIVGLSFGRIRVFRKTVEGTLAGLASCVLIAWLVSVLPGLDLPLGVGILGAVSASLVEALPIEVNDNVVIPVFSGSVMMIALQFLP
ncbi:phosphatidate cytidylyltransferase [candidate division WOR-3 bacterium]|nr:phosphatidate cytidylyltransferase [candidate division WOR-3 bacterium]